MTNQILQYLLDLVTRLGHWSYLIIFAAAALECAAFAGLFVPAAWDVTGCSVMALASVSERSV